MVFGFYDRLKTVSRGYASLDYEPQGLPATADLVRMDVLVNGERGRLAVADRPPPGLVHKRARSVREDEGTHAAQQFEVAIQAAIGSGSSRARR